MNDWAVCLDYELPMLFQRVVTYKMISSKAAIIIYRDKQYTVFLKSLHRIVPLAFIYGDSVSPSNHPEVIGIIDDIIYHFAKNEPIYLIKINGRKKSKRYFTSDLIYREQNDLFPKK